MSNKFSISKVQVLSRNQSISFMGLPADIVKFYPLTINTSDSPLSIELFENVVVTSSGTLVTPIPLDRNKREVSSYTLVYSNPQYTTSNNCIYSNITSGSYSKGVSPGETTSLLLKANINYVFKITNLTNITTNISINLTWDELDQNFCFDYI